LHLDSIEHIWNKIDEISALLPSTEAEKYDKNLNNNFKQFNDDLQSYFSNFTQAIGKVKFVDKKPNKLVSLFCYILCNSYCFSLTIVIDWQINH
jgi:protein involved in sex pheromone biosynthesis